MGRKILSRWATLRGDGTFQALQVAEFEVHAVCPGKAEGETVRTAARACSAWLPLPVRPGGSSLARVRPLPPR